MPVLRLQVLTKTASHVSISCIPTEDEKLPILTILGFDIQFLHTVYDSQLEG